MATIVIKNLTESVDLDRQAMATITGGARIRGLQPFPLIQTSQRIVDYPAGFTATAAKPARKPGK